MSSVRPLPSSSPSSPTSTSTSTTTLSTTSCYKLFSVMVSSSLPMPSLLPSSPTSTSTPPTTSHLHHHLLAGDRLGPPSRLQIIQQMLTELQTALSRVLNELERFLKKGNSSKFNGQDDGHFI